MNVMDVTEIQTFLAHRYPFLLVDRVTDYEAGNWLKAIKNVTINEPYFNGHFPGKPIMPGVLQIEALAQATGLLGFVTMEGQKDDETLYILVGVDKVKFRRQVVPGDQLELSVELKKKRGNIWMFNGEAKVDGEITTTAEIMCAEVKGGK